MKRWVYLLTFVSGAFFAVVLGLATSATFKASNVAAQQTASSQKWEYCSVKKTWTSSSSGLGGAKGAALIHYLQAEGVRQELVEFQPRLGRRVSSVGEHIDEREEALAKAVAKLGSEGWEMVGIEVTGDHNNFTAYVFKRPKP